ncbi:hypothetical protein EBBID32_44950 [Sphingobium indicum BiD32]|uniref:Uncharacterized protein n=1 Tax=Sphingobium indicum BiD32 TaxID=1301087 RepID=N1MTN2_9SPHN|nr:hypothetical protein EBBID32_44950 [Sphingobium indicum BiD32]
MSCRLDGRGRRGRRDCRRDDRRWCCSRRGRAEHVKFRALLAGIGGLRRAGRGQGKDRRGLLRLLGVGWQRQQQRRGEKKRTMIPHGLSQGTRRAERQVNNEKPMTPAVQSRRAAA